MKKNLILGALIAATIFQAAPNASANGKTDKLIIGGIIGGIIGNHVANDRNRERERDRRDRRDDWGRGPRRPGPDRGYPPPYRPAPPPPPQRGQADVQIDQVTRQGEGAWYRLTLRYPMTLSDVDVRVFNAGLKIHQADVITDRNDRIQLRGLVHQPVMGHGQYASSRVDAYERIVAIDIRAESYGGYADIAVGVSSPDGYPEISVSRY